MDKYINKSVVVLCVMVLLFGAGAAWAGPEAEKTSWEHAPTDYVVPPGMVHGGAFIDRILPMPPGEKRSDVWGGDNVKPRIVDNGLEDPDWSYWCMDVFRSGGKEHMFAVRWPEDAPKGHSTWPRSEVVHAVSDSPTGPFKVIKEIGRGHNVRCYQAKDGSWVIYVINGGYRAPSLEGPWERFNIEYDLRGTPAVSMSNHTFVRRADGSYFMMSRDGHVWISTDGVAPYRKITMDKAYPRIKGRFEDPIVWKDAVQYHLIVNDWFGRTAYYLRSRDGVSWVWDQGKAYDVNIARHADGTMEKWYKFERAGIRQDESGRATHIYFAVIDSRKDLDVGNDNHSSKIIALPLVVERKLAVQADGQTMRVTIRAEEGFAPASEVDVSSLRFGSPAAVDFGRGGAATGSQVVGDDLVVTFDSAAGEFKPADFAGKLLGKNKSGQMLFGYVRMPGHEGDRPLLSQRPAVFTKRGVMSVRVENFGLVGSKPTPMKVMTRTKDGRKYETQVMVPPLEPYAGCDLEVTVPASALGPGEGCDVTTIILPPEAPDARPVEMRLPAQNLD
jgi:hypothetical protein